METPVLKDIESRKSGSYFVKTFHVESIRLVAHLGLLLTFGSGGVITETLQGKLATIPPPNETVIFKFFGFNHMCNWVDHMPARLVASIFIPYGQLPYILYFYFYHKRLQRDVANNKISKSLLQFSSLITPFNILIVTQLHLWFVNPPNGVYGFTAHYIPYYLFQWALSLQLILNVGYYINTNEIPFGLPRCAAIFFMLVFIGLTLISQVSILVMLSDYTFINTNDYPKVAETFSWIYNGCMFILPIFISAAERKDSETTTLVLY